MGLKETLQADLTEAIRSRDELKSGTIRMLLAAIQVEEVAGKEARVLKDDEIIKVLSREAKKRREAADAYKDAGRVDKAEQETKEGSVILKYLPAQLSEDEVKSIQKRMGIEEPKYNIDFKIGETVNITDGPFKGFDGQVNEIDEQKGKIIKPQFVIEKLHELTKGDAIITTGVGQHQMWAAQYYKFKHPRHWCTSGGLGTMGYGLPTAMGVQAAQPGGLAVAAPEEAQELSQRIAAAVRQKARLVKLKIHKVYLDVTDFKFKFTAWLYENAQVRVDARKEVVNLLNELGQEINNLWIGQNAPLAAKVQGETGTVEDKLVLQAAK